MNEYSKAAGAELIDELLRDEADASVVPKRNETLAEGMPPRLHNPLKPAYELQHEKYEHRVIAYMKAQGLNDKEIAERTGLSPVTIGYVKKQPWFEKLVLTEIHKHGDAALEFLAQETLEAAKRLVDIARNAENDETRRKANNDILDRKYGKPNQPVALTQKRAEEMSDDELMAVLNQKN